tara:strand:- start:3264 stop:3809 length:546 start_codon:yes stop_codon:yes gene_type:complete
MAKKKKEAIVYKTIRVKGTRWNQNPERYYTYMECKKCGAYENASESSISVTCSKCVEEMVEKPNTKQPYQSTGKPRGWAFMAEYVHADGTVYHKGVEQPKLKGKKKPTVIVKKKTLTKKVKEKLMWTAAAKISVLKKELAKTKFKKDKKVIESNIKYFSRIALGKRMPKDYMERLYGEKVS